MERVLALIAIAMGTLSGAVGLAFAIFGKLNISSDIWFAYSLTLISTFMVYVYVSLEKNQRAVDALSNRPYEGLEIFNDSGSLLERITNLTVGAKTVCTVNLSDTPENFIHLKSYFSRVHSYIKKSKSLVSFRRIAGIQNAEKAAWLVATSADLISTSRVSVAFADMRHNNMGELCFHVVEREEGGFTFIFPSVDLTGKMPAFLIQNDLVAQSMIAHFDALWGKLPHLHEGQKIYPSALNILENWFPNLTSNAGYKHAKLAIGRFNHEASKDTRSMQ